MDKYEFNYKVDQLKKMVKQGEYETAMRIADSINWRRVHNTSLLSVVSEVYEKNGEYAEAKAVLELAFDKSSKGKRILYKLTILSLKANNLEDAEEYYREFYKESPEDARNYVLRYLILKEKNAHIDQMILTLEKYVEMELDEEWMYELAELYHKAGRSEDCIKACDNIMLMFGLGKYVDKAIELKTQKEGAPLTDYQIGLIENRDKYDDRFKNVPNEMEAEISYEPASKATVKKEPLHTFVPSVTKAPKETGSKEAAFDYQSQEMPVQEQEEEVYESRFMPREEYQEFADGNQGLAASSEAGKLDDAVDDLLQPDEELAKVLHGISHEYEESSDDEMLMEDMHGAQEELTKPAYQEEVIGEVVHDAWTEGTLEEDVLQETGPDDDFVQEESDAVDTPEFVEEDVDYVESGIDYAVAESEMDGSKINEDEAIAQIDNIVEGEQIGRDIKAMGEDVKEVEGSEHDKTKIISNIKAALEARETSTVIYADAGAGAEAEKIHIVEGDLMIEDLDYEEPDPDEEPEVFYKSAFVEVDRLEDSLSVAAEKLKEIYQVTGESKQIAKIRASKLNLKGVLAFAERIGQKDLIIEGASDLEAQAVDELIELSKDTDKSLIFVDMPAGIESLKENFPELFEICGGRPREAAFEEDDLEDVSDIIYDEEDLEPDTEEEVDSDVLAEEELEENEEMKKQSGVRSRSLGMRERRIFRGEQEQKEAVNKEPEHIEEDTSKEVEAEEAEESDEVMLEEMDLEAFVEYADKYASKIDCVISGSSKNALYERAEIMEEDGIILNRMNAESLIEEVADRAEKPSFLRRIASIFSKRYDKIGRLILKEEHFIS